MNSMPISAAATAAAPSVSRRLSPPDADVALLVAATSLVAGLEGGRTIDAHTLRAATTRLSAAPMRTVPGTGRQATTPARPRKSCSCASSARHAQARARLRRARRCWASSRPSAHPYPSLGGEPGAPAVLDADRARLRCRTAAAHRIGRPRARAVGRDGAARHLCRARRRPRSCLNELGRYSRRICCAGSFPVSPVTRHDAAHIHDHLDAAVRPSVVLMNPPFSAAAHVDGALRTPLCATSRRRWRVLLRVAAWSRSRAPISPRINPTWRDAFVRLQERGRVVFSAAIEGRIYARHGTTVETRLTVIDRVPADDPDCFPPSPGMAPDAATLLAWVRQTFHRGAVDGSGRRSASAAHRRSAGTARRIAHAPSSGATAISSHAAPS